VILRGRMRTGGRGPRPGADSRLFSRSEVKPEGEASSKIFEHCVAVSLASPLPLRRYGGAIGHEETPPSNPELPLSAVRGSGLAAGVGPAAPRSPGADSRAADNVTVDYEKELPAHAARPRAR
jgi:hypothetical protein